MKLAEVPGIGLGILKKLIFRFFKPLLPQEHLWVP